MQEYKSQQNIALELKAEKRAETRRGEAPFSVNGNTSGRVTIKFTKEYNEPPFVLLNLIVLEGSEFQVSAIMTSLTNSDFTFNIQNTSDKPTKGIVQWVLV